MSDRTAQARAEAERQIHVYGDDFKARTLRANLNDAFVQGVEWADANPQPDTLREVQAVAWEEGRASAGIMLPTKPPQQPRNPYRRDER